MGMSVGKIMGVVILVIVGLMLLPIVQSSVTDAVNTSSSSTVDSLLPLVTIFYVLGIVQIQPQPDLNHEIAAVMWVVHESGGISGKS